MAIDYKLLNLSLNHYASELYRLLGVRCELTGTRPEPTVMLMAALIDFQEAEAPKEKTA